MNAMDFYWMMLIIFVPLSILQLRLSLFPDAKGSIVRVHDYVSCYECGTLKRKIGHSSIDVTVKLDDGGEVEAIVSPCNICMERFTTGSRVAVNKINGTYQVHPLIWGDAR